MRFLKLSLVLAYLSASFLAVAQVSYVPITGTVVDPQGHPLANAAISATLVDKYGNPVTSAKTPNGSLYNGNPGPGSVYLDAAGTFSVGLVPNGTLTNPSATQWRIDIDAPVDRAILSYEPSWRITYTLTVTTSQDLSSQLSALAKPVAFFNLITNQSTIQGGLITAISAGAGLSGGGSSGNVTIGCAIATNGSIGCAKPDGTTITIDVDGTLHAIASSSTVNVNGVAVANPNFNGSTPAAGANGKNVAFQVSGSSVSAELVGDGNPAHYFDGTGNFSTPAGSGSTGTITLSPSIINSFGDSITQGNTSSGLPNIWDAFPYKLSTYAGSAVLTDSAQNGYYACDVIHQMTAGENPVSGPNPLLSTVMAGANDSWFQLSSYQVTSMACHYGLVSWLGIPSTGKVTGASSTTTGTCIKTDNTLAIGTGASCSASGSTITFSITTNGAPIYIWYRNIDSDTGTWTYAVDGGSTTAVSTAPSIPIHNTPIAGGSSSAFSNSLAFIRVTASSGSHSVVFTQTASGTMPILAVGTLDATIPSAFLPVVAVADISLAHLIGASSYNTNAAAFNAAIATEVSTLLGDGLRVVPVPTNTYFQAQATDTLPTGCQLNACVHPNTAGHTEILRAFLSKLSFAPQNGVAGAPILGLQIQSGNYTINCATDGFVFDNGGTVTVPLCTTPGRQLTIYNYSTSASVALSVAGGTNFSPSALGPLSAIVLEATGSNWFVVNQYGGSVEIKGSAYTATETDNTIFVNGGATITLPSTNSTTGNGGHPLTIYNFDASLTSTITGATHDVPSTLGPGHSITIVPTGLANWWLAASNFASGGGTTTNALTMNNSNTGDVSSSTFNGSAAKTISTNTIGAPNLAASNTYSGSTINDFSATSQIKLPSAAGYAPAATGEIGHDTTNKNWHAWGNAVDNIIPVVPIASLPSNGNCAQWDVTAGVYKLTQAAGPCGTSSGTVTVTGTPAGGDIAAFSSASSITTATATQVNTLIKTLTGCNTATNVYVPQSGTCVAPAAGGGNYTNITGSSQIAATGCTQSASTGGNCAVTGSSTTAVTFSVIPGTYQALRLVYYGQSTTGTPVVNITFNADTGANYAVNGYVQNNTTGPATSAAAGRTACLGGFLYGLAGQAINDIPGYADTSFVKTMVTATAMFASVSANTNTQAVQGCVWNNTAAITSITVTVSANDYAAGTKFILYGIN